MMYAQAAIKPNHLLRNGAYGIVMRGVQRAKEHFVLTGDEIRECVKVTGAKLIVGSMAAVFG